MEEQAKLWITARDIIAKALWEFRETDNRGFIRGYITEDDKHNAAAILARLTHNNPPILIDWDHEIKEKP